jgi:hypothetical protein
VLPRSGNATEKPKQADFKARVEHVCSVSLAGQTHEQRRHLFKTSLDEAWRFSNWLTHMAKNPIVPDEGLFLEGRLIGTAQVGDLGDRAPVAPNDLYESEAPVAAEFIRGQAVLGS